MAFSVNDLSKALNNKKKNVEQPAQNQQPASANMPAVKKPALSGSSFSADDLNAAIQDRKKSIPTPVYQRVRTEDAQNVDPRAILSDAAASMDHGDGPSYFSRRMNDMGIDSSEDPEKYRDVFRPVMAIGSAVPTWVASKAESIRLGNEGALEHAPDGTSISDYALEQYRAGNLDGAAKAAVENYLNKQQQAKDSVEALKDFADRWTGYGQSGMEYATEGLDTNKVPGKLANWSLQALNSVTQNLMDVGAAKALGIGDAVKPVEGASQTANKARGLFNYVPFAERTFGAAAGEARRADVDLSTQLDYALKNTVKEVATEMMWSTGDIFGVGGFDDLAEKGVKSLVRKSAATGPMRDVLSTAASLGMAFTTEAIEEAVGALIEEYSLKQILDPDAQPPTGMDLLKTLGESAMIGGLSGMMMGGGNVLSQNLGARINQTRANASEIIEAAKNSGSEEAVALAKKVEASADKGYLTSDLQDLAQMTAEAQYETESKNARAQMEERIRDIQNPYRGMDTEDAAELIRRGNVYGAQGADVANAEDVSAAKLQQIAREVTKAEEATGRSETVRQAVQEAKSGTVSDETAERILNDARATEYFGADVTPNMTEAERSNVVKAAIETVAEAENRAAAERNTSNRATTQSEENVNSTGRFFDTVKETLGESGQAAFTNLMQAPTPAMSPQLMMDRARAAAIIYNAGTNGTAIESIRIQNNPLTATEMSAMYSAGVNDGRQSGIRTGERQNDLAASERSREISQRARETRARRQGATVQRTAVRAAVENEAAVSPKEIGFRNGSDTKNLKVLPESAYSALNKHDRAAVEQLKKKGFKVVLMVSADGNGIGGLLKDVQGKHYRGAIQDGNTIFLSADHWNYTVEQIARHEYFHSVLESNEGLRSAIVSRLYDQFSAAEILNMQQAYAEDYNWSGVDADYVLDEILCDAFGGMDVFEDKHLFPYHVTDYAEIVREMAKDAEAGATTEGETKYSSQKEVLALKGVDWMDDYSGIRSQLRKHADEINRMDPVAEVEYVAGTSRAFMNDLANVVVQAGGRRMKNSGASFDFDQESIRHINAHAKSNELRAAALAAPYVAKYGILISGHRNHEGHNTTTLTFAAPAILNGTRVNVGVAIMFNKDGRPHAVNVELQAGGRFYLDKKKAPHGNSSRVYRYGKGTVLPNSSASSEYNIAQSPEDGNNESFRGSEEQMSFIDMSEDQIKLKLEKDLGMDKKDAAYNAKTVSGIGDIYIEGSTFNGEPAGRTLAVAFREELIQDGHASLIGKQVRNAKDLATLAQVYRNPRFETMRYFFTNDSGEVVYHTGVSSGLVSSSAVAPSNAFLLKAIREAKAAGATGAYVLHNHPSGDPTPSGADISVQMVIDDYFSRHDLQSHGGVIINSNRYASYGGGQRTATRPLGSGVDELLSPAGRTELVGMTVTNTGGFANLGKAIQLSPDYSAVIYLGAKLNVVAVQEVHNDIAADEVAMSGWIENNLGKYGAERCAIVTGDDYCYHIAMSLMKDGVSLDAVHTQFRHTAVDGGGRSGSYLGSRSAAAQEVHFSEEKDVSGRALSEGQAEYFKESKVRDEQGRLTPVYHGTGRMDRVGTVFRADRATSGPMSFFTDNRIIAENYSKDKKDTSIAYDERYQDYYTQFRVVRDGKDISVSELWNKLSQKDKNRILTNAPHITMDDDYENVIYDKKATRGLGNWDAYLLKSNGGNALKALTESWLDDGNLYGQEADFVEVLRLSGVEGVEYYDPQARQEGVYEEYLNITNPFDAVSMVTEDFVRSFESWYEQQDISRYEESSAGADLWDKRNISAESFAQRMRSDIQSGTSHAWTSIPDSMTDYLKEQGYDGIMDRGGKGGGEGHTVWIPFESNQIKNVDNLNPTEDPDIRYSEESSYAYENLILKPAMKVTVFDSSAVGVKATKGGNIDANPLVKAAKERSDINVGGGFSQEYVYVDDIKSNVLMQAEGIRHGIQGRITKMSSVRTAEITPYLPDILRNSIAINERSPRTAKDGENSFILIGYAETKDGDHKYIVRSTINRYADNRAIPETIEIYDVLKGAKAKKTDAAVMRGYTARTAAAKSSNAPASLTISIADLLELVKENYPEFLSENVRSAMNIDVEPADGLKYSEESSNFSARMQQSQDELERLQQDLALSQAEVAYWKQARTTGTHVINKADVKRVSNDVLKKWDATVKVGEITGRMEELADSLYQGMGIDEVLPLALDIADDICSSARVIADGEAYETYKDIRKYFRENKIKRVDGIGDPGFYKRNFGKIRFAKEGRAVDAMWDDWQSRWGVEFFPDDVVTSQDKVLHLVEVLDSIESLYENPYSRDYAEAVEACAYSLMDDIMSGGVRYEPVMLTSANGRAASEYNRTIAEKNRQIEQLQKQNENLEEKYKEREARAKELLQQVRKRRDERLSELKQHYKEVAMNKKWRRAESDARHRLQRIAKRLQNRKLPAVSRDLLNQYIGNLDTAALSITGKKLDELKDLQAWYTNRKATDPDFIANPDIEKKLARINQKRISELSIDEVVQLTQVLMNIENTINTERQMIDSEDRRDIYAQGLETIDDIMDAKGTKANLRDWIVSNTLSPVRAVRRFTGYAENSPLYKAVEALADGQRKMFDYQMQAYRMFDTWANDQAYTKSLQEPVKIQGFRNGVLTEVEITKDMAIALYMHSKNDQNLAHISYGGVTIPDLKALKKDPANAYGQGAVRIKMSPAMVKAIEGKLSAKDKAYAAAAAKYFDTMAQMEINEVSEKLVGYSLAQVENYFPINTDANFTRKEFESLRMDGTIEGMGDLKERTDAKNPIYLRGFTDVLNKSIDMNSKYVGLAIPVRNFNKLWNVTTADYSDADNIQHFTGSVKEAMSQKWGKRGVNYIEKMMTDLQNANVKSDELDSLLGKVRSNYAGAVLTLNLSVAIKQAASYPTAGAVLGGKALAKALANPKVDPNLIAKYTPLYWYRSQGFADQELGDLKRRNRQIPKLLNWIQAADMATTRTLWKASEYYVRDNKNLQIGTDAYYQEVARIYNRVIEETQPNYTTMQRPQLLRSDSSMVQSIAMFKTQPFQNFNVLYDAVGEYEALARAKKAGADVDLKQAGKNVRRAVSSQVVQLAVFSAMTFIWNMIRRKHDKYEDEEGEMTAASTFKGIGKDMVSGSFSMVLFGSNMYELMDSIINGAQYYGFDSVTITALDDTAKAIINQWNLVKDATGTVIEGGTPDWNTFRIKTKKNLNSISKLAGIPVENVNNLYEAAYHWAAIYSEGEYMGEYRYLCLTISPNSSKVKYYALLKKAWLNDQKAFDQLQQEMLDSGYFTEKGINQKIGSWKKEVGQ